MYLKMEINRKESGALITQQIYAKQVIKTFNMTDCKITKTPITLQEIPEISDEKYEMDFPFREEIGSLIYFT